MRKNLNLKLSWYTPENLEALIEEGYLPVFVSFSPEVYQGTPVHFQQLAPGTDMSLKEYKEYLEENIKSWKIINSFDILSHVSCAKGIVILTDIENDPYRQILGDYLGGYLETKLTNYEYHREQS